jgi:hypothetical protein
MATELKTPELSRHAAAAFAERWKNTTEELQHAQSFWADFFRTLCGIEDEKLAGIEYQKKVKGDVSGNQEYIDVYWKNVALIEHKSAGKNLDKAEIQARGYLRSLPPGYRPRTIIVSDFAVIRVIDVVLNRTHEFPLSSLPDNIHRFEAIISGNRTHISQEEITVDQEAARLMANLYLELESHGYEGHETSIFLVRILFLLFGDDTGMWAKNSFLKLVMATKEDGSDIGSKLDGLFRALDTPTDKRVEDLNGALKPFPYVNGGIFTEKISVFDFDRKMRVALVDVANYDWTTINPTIFGSLFQLIKSKEERHALGEHYTSEENINKIIYPLFLDTLQERLASSWDSKKELKKLRLDLAKIKVLDPACGCGNFLVVAYKHLRQLELELTVRLQNLEGKESDLGLDGTMGLSISLSQLTGIEIEEWPAQVARVALFLTDHQENLKLERITGSAPQRFPIKESANIVIGNALELEWSKVVDIDEYTYILGNPPFLGSLLLSETQKMNQKTVWANHPKSGIVDFVTNWYLLAARYVQDSNCLAAFVSTSSISQGEQPAILWSELKKFDIHIYFAHSRFLWSNDSAGMAAVSCVIIGLCSSKNLEEKKLWSYPNSKGEGILTTTRVINAYLTDGPEVIVSSRSNPLSPDFSTMYFGSMPRDNGHLSKISEEEAVEIRKDGIASKYLFPCVGADELLNGGQRYALWLEAATPAELASSPILKERIKLVKKMRSESKAASTKRAAETSHLFVQRAQPATTYIAVPRVSSENRQIIPMAYLPSTIIATDALLTIADERLSTFAILQSRTFTIWAAAVSGRLETRIRISAEITYHNFPCPKLSADLREKLDDSGKVILKEREAFPDSTLSDMYNPGAMPPGLVNAHVKNEKLVLSAYGLKPNASDEEILARLFKCYVELSDPALFSEV